MKQKTAILFVLLANICMLAHAVIPHHHHDRMAVAVISMAEFAGHDQHSHDNKHSHYHHNHNGQGSHPHSNNSEDCLISDSPILSPRIEKAAFGTDDNGHNNITADLFYTAWGAGALPLLPDSQLTSYSYQASIPPNIDTCCNGLRAPPHH